MTNTPKFWGAFLYIYIMGSKDTHTDTDDNRLTAELYIDEKSRTLILKIRDFRDDVSAVVNYDPRFTVRDEICTVDKDSHTVTVTVLLNYQPTATATELALKFDNEFREQL